MSLPDAPLPFDRDCIRRPIAGSARWSSSGRRTVSGWGQEEPRTATGSCSSAGGTNRWPAGGACPAEPSRWVKPLADGVARELLEETGLIVDVGPIVDVLDRIMRDDDGRVRYHFVLVDYLCLPTGGALEAGYDVSDARVVLAAAAPAYDLTPETHAVCGPSRARTLNLIPEPGP